MPSLSTAIKISLTDSRMSCVTCSPIGWAFFRYSISAPYPGCPYCAVQPPSTSRLAPVISPAAGEAKKSTAPVTSSTRPRRPNGIRDRVSSLSVSSSRRGLVMGVSTNVGDGVDPNLVRGKLDGHSLRQALHGMLGGAVDRAPRCPYVPHLRRDVDDGAAFATLNHAPSGSLGDQEDAFNIDRKHPVEVVLGHLKERLRHVRSGIVDEDVNLPQEVHCLSHLARVGDVANCGLHSLSSGSYFTCGLF